MSRIDIPVTDVNLNWLHLHTDNKGGVSHVSLEYDLLTSSGQKVGEFKVDETMLDSSQIEELVTLIERLKDWAVDPINRELKLLEVPNGDRQEGDIF